MQIYEFDSRQMDHAFLEGEHVICKAVLPRADLRDLKKGDRIVIQLSTRAKYMGLVTKVEMAETARMALGYFEVRKY
jgi:hypothetical protein